MKAVMNNEARSRPDPRYSRVLTNVRTVDAGRSPPPVRSYRVTLRTTDGTYVDTRSCLARRYVRTVLFAWVCGAGVLCVARFVGGPLIALIHVVHLCRMIRASFASRFSITMCGSIYCLPSSEVLLIMMNGVKLYYY